MCSVAGCELKAKARGWCNIHYKCWKRNGDPEKRIRHRQGPACRAPGCETPPTSHGLCVKHLRRWNRHGDLDTVKSGGVPRSRPERELEFTCAVCGRIFERERKPGRPSVCCSDECRALKPALKARIHYYADPEQTRARRKARGDKITAYNRARYKANREQEIQRSLAYARGAGKDAKRARDAARYALTRGAVGAAERFTLDEIFNRDDGVCHLCGDVVDRRDASMDHVIPVTKGGPHTRANVKLAHRSCNTRKGNRLLAA